MNPNYYFFPEINKNSGYGHFFRVIKYSYYLRGKIFFILKSKISKKLMYQLKSKKIEFISLKNLKQIKKSNSYLIIDSYSTIPRTLRKIKFRKIFLISDKKPIKNKSDVIVDHTFGRKIKFYDKEISKGIKCFVGVNYFPFGIKKKKINKDFILINFGSVNDKKLIQKSLKIATKFNEYTIFILSESFSAKDLSKEYLKNKIIIKKYVSDMRDIYKRTIFSIGSCGISLYEKIFHNIPCICSQVIGNQKNNYINFHKKGLIIKLSDALKMDIKRIKEKLKLIEKKSFVVRNYNYNKIKKIFEA